MREVLRALLPCAMQMRCVCVSLDSAKSGKWVGIREIPNSSEHLPFPCLHKLHVFYHTRSLFFLQNSLLSQYSAIVRASTVTELQLRIRSRSRCRYRSCDEDSPHLSCHSCRLLCDLAMSTLSRHSESSFSFHVSKENILRTIFLYMEHHLQVCG